MKIVINNIPIKPDEPESRINEVLKVSYGLKNVSYTILKKSLDARKKDKIVYTYRVLVEISNETAGRLLEKDQVTLYKEERFPDPPVIKKRDKVIIIGSGPAGLFSALRLVNAGVGVEIFERGKDVSERLTDIKELETHGNLDPESNVLFGEGGAGTYSDGKLTTRINRLEVRWFYEQLVEFGADPSLLVESKPHLGTDQVRKIVQNMREFIISRDSQVHFNERIDEIVIEKGKLVGIKSSTGSEYPVSRLILATGHSARDIYHMLKQKGVAMEKKGFAAGLRIEHPAELIREIQYGRSEYRKILPAPDYTMAYNSPINGRGIYTFCMCPGGMVINSSSVEKMLCLNGMSYAKRDSRFSNSAIIVTVNPDDTGEELLSGIDFQEKLESRAYESGGGGFTAPVQRALSFVNKRLDNNLPKTSYRPGVRAADMEELLPSWMTAEIREALLQFNRKMKGFLSEDALLLGVETRSSSPVRVLRGDNYQSVNIQGLYPVGEGSGYAGGIVSSAVDGVRAADAILKTLCL